MVTRRPPATHRARTLARHAFHGHAPPMAKYGLQASYGDAENGMIQSDMRASVSVANALDEVIIFRSTGPWSQRWIKQSYPTKNFHVKGKSSDWGPQAG